MTLSPFGTRRAAAALLLAALPLAAQAQNSLQDSLLRSGDLVGGRPRATSPRAAATRPSAVASGTLASARPRAAARAANADPTLSRMLHESIDVGQVPASQLPDLYARFVEATHDQRRQWSARDWAEASAALGRLNARYEAVRLELPLNERLNVRSYQGEFRTLEAARATKDRLN
ncbi:hypothetical protein HHL22_06170 [Hymenobacter sp. RP-2-7]|uniref:Uncharacterized protein n=1 Tax=Hymenobacter polaris TaxID=2682546 RepID=A0A7Y0FLU6_9BACT|nr:hypothetical protein [Hymenobacter polaris]NML64786.1 hypothetical protein [Hymenobacter polaris]